MMSCGKVIGLMSAVIDGESGQIAGEFNEIEDHIRVCTNCAIELSNQRRIKERLAQVRFSDPPIELTRRIKTVLSSKERSVAQLFKYAIGAAAVFIFVLTLQKTVEAEPPFAVKSSAVFFDRILQNNVDMIETNDPTKICRCLAKLQSLKNVDTKGFICRCNFELNPGEYACIVYSKQNELIGVFPCEQLKGLENEFKIYQVGKNNVLVKPGQHGATMWISRLNPSDLKALVGMK